MMNELMKPRYGVSSVTLDRILSSKESEEHRHLEAFLERLALRPAAIEKSECPDFFLRFGGPLRSSTIGLEIVRFDSPTKGASQLSHVHRWKRFATRLDEELRGHDLRVYGTVHPRRDVPTAFDDLLRREDQAVAEICNVLRRGGTTTGALRQFAMSAEPNLSATVDAIFFVPRDGEHPRLWWCSTLQSGGLEEPLQRLRAIVNKKNLKAASWEWRSADERWLLVVAEAQALGDTMVLSRHDRSELPSIAAPAFSRVFAWDGFSEEIHQLHPSGGVVFQVDSEGVGILHRRMFPEIVLAFCPPLCAAPE